MSAERQLTEAYGEWRHLAEIEGEAIATRNWALVAASQKALQQLQDRIARLSPTARQERPQSRMERAARERALENIIRELIALGRRNQTLLKGMSETARVKLDELGQASRNLRQLQRSYATPSPANWTSLS